MRKHINELGCREVSTLLAVVYCGVYWILYKRNLSGSFMEEFALSRFLLGSSK